MAVDFAGRLPPPANCPLLLFDWNELFGELPLAWNPGNPPPADALEDWVVEKFELPVSVPLTFAILFSGLGSITGTSSALLVGVSGVS